MFVFPQRLHCRWLLIPFLVIMLVQANFLTDLYDRLTNKKTIKKAVENQEPPVVTDTTTADSSTTTVEQLRIQVLHKPESCDEFAIKGKQVYFNFLAAVYTEKGEKDGTPEGMLIDKGGSLFPITHS